MEAREKEGIGFRTSASDMQDRFDEVRKLLMRKEAQWGKLRELSSSRRARLFRQLQDAEKSPDTSEYEKIILGNLVDHWDTMAVIAEIGKAILATHKRLAKIEKDIEELKLRSK